MNIYMPPSAPPPQIWLSEGEVTEQMSQQRTKRAARLGYLAESGKAEPSRTYIPDSGQNRCCDTTLFDIFFRIICNPWRLVKDAACGCFPACSMPEPKNKPYMPEDVYNRLRSADVYLNRNTCLLCCVTPIVLSTFPFAGFISLSTKKLLCLTSLAGAATNDCSIFSAGCLTYFWSGDFGGREQRSYEELKVIYDDLADFLKERWQEGRTDEADELKQLCEKIRRNSLNIIEGIRNGGLSSAHAEDATKKFFLQINSILTGTHFASIQPEESGPILLSPVSDKKDGSS